MLSEQQIIRLQVIKDKLVVPCSECGGVGYVGDLRCSCMKIFEYIMHLVRSNIPETYWELSLNELHIPDGFKKFAKLIAKNLDKAVNRSLGAIFVGPNGVGKTSLVCEIGKRAITSRYHESVIYVTVQQFINAHYDKHDDNSDDNSLLDTINSASVVLLDELDKVYIKKESDFVVRTLEEFFRNALSRGCAIFTASNWTMDDILDQFGESFVSLIKRNTKILPFDGSDFSETRQDVWMDLLEREIDYYAPDIIVGAERLNKILISEESSE